LKPLALQISTSRPRPLYLRESLNAVSGCRRAAIGGRSNVIPKRNCFLESGYEKDHKASAIISTVKAAKSISRPDLRIRRLPFFSRRTGVPLTASTNKMSFTSRVYQTEGPETAE
jgi:hypothetical protein